MKALEIRHLSLGYHRLPLMEGANFCLDKGKFYLLEGKNGTGKTTLLRAILGLKSIDRGTIEIHCPLAYLPDSDSFFLDRSGEDNLRLFAHLYQSKNCSTDSIHSLLKEFGLYWFRSRPVQEYSQGMRKKLSIIRLLLSGAEFYLIDEPFNALDKETIDLVIRIFEKQKHRGIGALVVSHHLPPLLESLIDAAYTLEEKTIFRKS